MIKAIFRAAVIAAATLIVVSSVAQDDKSAKGEKKGDSAAGSKEEAQASKESPPASDTAAEAAPADTDTPAKKEAGQGTYTVRLRDLEDRVNRLKEQIFRSKARLSLLAETVLERKIAGARTKIVFRNEMGNSFRLQKATFLLDGGAVFNKTDEAGSLAEKDSIVLFDGPVVPGDHTLNIVLNYQGNGYGVFSYLKGYSFKTRSSHTFAVSEGKLMTLVVIGFEKGGATTPLEERPAIRYKEDLTDYTPSEDSNVKDTGGSE